MSPPALFIAGSVVIIAGVTIAFHQLVYEPHIAPKLENFIEEWLEQLEQLEQPRTRNRQLTRPVEAGRFERGRFEADDVRPLVTRKNTDNGLEMKTISMPLKVTAVDTGFSAVPSVLRHRTKGPGEHESMVLESPNSFIPFTTLVPANIEKQMAGSPSPTSTPSSISSSVLALQSPVIGSGSPNRIETGDDHSHPSSSIVDSILEPTQPFTPASPTRSITHISPRSLFLTIGSQESQTDDDEETRPLSDIRQRALALTSQRLDSSTRSHSPGASTLHESFATPTEVETTAQRSSSPSLIEAQRAHILRVPSQDSHGGRRTPGSTASWSEVASDSGDEPEYLVASDNESWASVSERVA